MPSPKSTAPHRPRRRQGPRRSTDTQRVLDEIEFLELTELDRLAHIYRALLRMETRMSEFGDRLTELQADVTAEDSVIDSAVTLLQGIPKLIADAVATALESGATPEQLAAITALGTDITAKSGALAEAVAANTPAA